MWEWSFAPRRNSQFKRTRVSEVPPNEPIRASCRVVQKCRLSSRQGAHELGERSLALLQGFAAHIAVIGRQKVERLGIGRGIIGPPKNAAGFKPSGLPQEF